MVDKPGARRAFMPQVTLQALGIGRIESVTVTYADGSELIMRKRMLGRWLLEQQVMASQMVEELRDEVVTQAVDNVLKNYQGTDA